MRQVRLPVLDDVHDAEDVAVRLAGIEHQVEAIAEQVDALRVALADLRAATAPVATDTDNG